MYRPLGLTDELADVNELFFERATHSYPTNWSKNEQANAPLVDQSCSRAPLSMQKINEISHVRVTILSRECSHWDIRALDTLFSDPKLRNKTAAQPLRQYQEIAFNTADSVVDSNSWCTRVISLFCVQISVNKNCMPTCLTSFKFHQKAHSLGHDVVLVSCRYVKPFLRYSLFC